MPRLKGNSSHGSKPITSLSRTFSWTPHCWPQKQQCVLTSRSGSTLVDSRTPLIADRCGPNCSMIFSGLTGIVATISPRVDRDAPRQVLAPGARLRKAEQRTAATGADLLIVLVALIHLVRKPKLAFDGGEIPHHDCRRVGLPAAAARRLLAPGARVLVEADADLRRPLENVKQLAEREV